MTQFDIPVLSEHTRFNEDEVTPTLLNTNTGHIFIMNQVGHSVFLLCDGREVGAILEAVGEKYSGVDSQQIGADVEAFLKAAEHGGLIKWQRK
jgi:hypothetical protein